MGKFSIHAVIMTSTCMHVSRAVSAENLRLASGCFTGGVRRGLRPHLIRRGLNLVNEYDHKMQLLRQLGQLVLMEGRLSHMFGPRVVLLLLLVYPYPDMECERSAGIMVEENLRRCKKLICSCIRSRTASSDQHRSASFPMTASLQQDVRQ